MARPRYHSADAYRDLWAAARPSHETEAVWAQDLRARALDDAVAQGIPSRRVEHWKYTDVRDLAEAPLPIAARSDDLPGADAGTFGTLDAHTLLIVNGHLMTAFSDLPQGVEVASLSFHLADPPPWLAEQVGRVRAPFDQPLAALNAAFVQDGVVLRVGAGVAVDRPIRILHAHAGDPAAAYTRTVIRLEEGAAATVVEDFAGADGHLANAVTEIAVCANAALLHVRAHRGEGESRHIGALHAGLARDARLTLALPARGGALTRLETVVALEEPGAEFVMTAPTMLRGREHADNTVTVTHAAPHCRSNQVLKNVLADRARGVVQDAITVAEGAAGSDGHQLIQGLLLNAGAEQNAKPELYIWNDDVKCSHGATVGQLDQRALFYLRSRGVPEADARAMLIRAFLEEAVDMVPNEAIRRVMSDDVDAWLGVAREEESA